MYKVVQIDMSIPYPINKKGQPDKYSEPKKFETKKDAEKWIERHSYTGMSWKYIVEEWSY